MSNHKETHSANPDSTSVSRVLRVVRSGKECSALAERPPPQAIYFEVAILSDKLIRPPTRELMWTRLKPSDSSESDPTYILGWAIHDRDVSAFGHTGGQQGTSTAFLISPAGKAGVVVLADMEGIESSDLAVKILKMLVGTPGTSGH